MGGPEAAEGKPAEVRGLPTLRLVLDSPLPSQGELSRAPRTEGWGLGARRGPAASRHLQAILSRGTKSEETPQLGN